MKFGFTDIEWETKIAEIRKNNQVFISIQEGLDTEDDTDSWREAQGELDELIDRRADADQTRGF